MKKITLIIAMLAFTFTSVAQKNEWHESRFERAKVFTEVAAKEFGLTKAQQEELYDKKVLHFEESYKANQKFNKGEITKEEKKIPNKKFGKYFNKLTGKKYKELKPFYEKVKIELDKLKK